MLLVESVRCVNKTHDHEPRDIWDMLLSTDRVFLRMCDCVYSVGEMFPRVNDFNRVTIDDIYCVNGRAMEVWYLWMDV